MNMKVDELLPSAEDCTKKMAEAEAAKASDYIRKQAAVEAEKKALLDKLKALGVSDEERLKRAAATINRAVGNGVTEIEVGVLRTAFSPTWPRHQSAGARLGGYAHRVAQGAV